MTEHAPGDEITCDECGKSSEIELPPVTLFGSEIYYGDGGPEDQYIVSQEGETTCYDCGVENYFTATEREELDL